MPANDNTRIFDDDDQPEDLILTADQDSEKSADPPETDEDFEQPAQSAWDIFREGLIRWKIPIVLGLMVSSLVGYWHFLRQSQDQVEVNISLEDTKHSQSYDADRFRGFNESRRAASKLIQQVESLSYSEKKTVSLMVYDYLREYDTPAINYEDRFLINRIGDRYTQVVRERLDQNSRKVSTFEIKESLRWLKENFETENGGTIRPKVDLIEDFVVFYEEYGDRIQESEPYQQALDYVNRWNQIDTDRPRHYLQARLHFKLSTEESVRASREFIASSLQSNLKDEINHRFQVKTLYAKILAGDGQIVEAEKVFSEIIEKTQEPLDEAETSFQLGEMRKILARRALEEENNPQVWYGKSLKAYRQAREIYEGITDPTDQIVHKREVTIFQIGSVRMFQGIYDPKMSSELVEARDIFNRLSRRNRLDLPFLHAINLRRAQVSTALDRGPEAEEILTEIMDDHKQRLWDRTNLVSPFEVVEIIQNLAQVHEKNKKYKNQIDVLNHLANFLKSDDKTGKMRQAISIARAWNQQSELVSGVEAREGHRQAALAYLNFLEEPNLRFRKKERLDLLWSTYLEYKACYDPENLKKWEVPLERRDQDAAIDVLDLVIDVGSSPRANILYNQALYLKGLLQEELLRFDQAIKTHDTNINTLTAGGDNFYIYLSYLQKARTRAKLGTTEALEQAVKDCEALFANPQVTPEALPWEEARFLHGSLNIQLALRAEPNSTTQIEYLKEGVRSLDEAINRYPNSPYILQSRVNSGLAKIRLNKLDPTHSLIYMQAAVEDFSTAERIAQSKNLTPEQRHLKKVAMMNLGLAYMELEGNHISKAIKTFDRLARAYRRDRVEPWALIQLHRAYRQLAQIERNSARQSNDVNLQRRIQQYYIDSKRAAEKAISSWEQVLKLTKQPFSNDFPLAYWREYDDWVLDLERVIDSMREQTANL